MCNVAGDGADLRERRFVGLRGEHQLVQRRTGGGNGGDDDGQRGRHGWLSAPLLPVQVRTLLGVGGLKSARRTATAHLSPIPRSPGEIEIPGIGERLGVLADTACTRTHVVTQPRVISPAACSYKPCAFPIHASCVYALTYSNMLLLPTRLHFTLVTATDDTLPHFKYT